MSIRAIRSMSLCLLFLGVAALALTGMAVAGTSQFSAPFIFFSTDGFDIATGDVNEDGAVDLVVASSFGSEIAVHLGAGNGGFFSNGPFDAGVPRAQSVALGDVNEDGHQDVITSGSVLLGAGDGTFGPPILLPLAQFPQFAAVGDFNGDNHLDVAVAVSTDQANDCVSIFLGGGDATFAPEARYGVGDLPRSLAIADFNGDSNLDLAVANRNPPNPPRPDGKDEVSILLGNGDGTFQGQRVVPAETVRMHGIVSGDFNKDGRADFAAGTEGTTDISIHLGNGDGSFAAGISLAAGACPIKLAVGDYDRDGNPDLATANWCGDGNVSILLGDGSGSFVLDGQFATDAGVQMEIPRGQFPVGIVTGDFDRDGRQDLATANWQSFSVSVLLNEGPFGSCRDADGDGFGVFGTPNCPGGLQDDCDDTDAGVFPGAPEVCDQRDNDCDSLIDEGFDADGDGFSSCGGDCNDGDPAINPGATEICDGIDNNCDGVVDVALKASCAAVPTTLNFASNGRDFTFDVSLTNLCTGESVDASLLSPAYVSGFSSPTTGTVNLPAPFAGPGCDNTTDDGIWEDLAARKIQGNGTAILSFDLPADGLCRTRDGNRQELIAILQDIPDGEVADVCITATYPGIPAGLTCCDAIGVVNKGNR